MEYLVIDTESCTGRDNDGSLCSLGYAICDENLNVLEQRDLLFNPLPKNQLLPIEAIFAPNTISSILSCV